MGNEWNDDDPTASPKDGSGAEYVEETTDWDAESADLLDAGVTPVEGPAGQADETDQPDDDQSGLTQEAAVPHGEPDEPGGSDSDPDPQVLRTEVEEAIAGPLTTPPVGADRDLLPGLTDVAADLGHALGVGTDDLGLVEVEVNGLMGVRVRLDPGVVQLGTELVGHSLAAALEQARAEVVTRLDDHFRSDTRINDWIAEATRRPEAMGAPTETPERARQVTVSSPDGLVSVVVDPGGQIGSVVVADGELDLARLATAFVRAAESALQGVDDDGSGLDTNRRLEEFDRAMAALDKSLDALDQELSDVLKQL